MSTTMLATRETAVPQAAARAGKYLTFQLANEEFGIRVVKVREIMGLQDITAVPADASAHQGGDQPARQGGAGDRSALEVRHGGGRYTQRTCIIVAQVQGEATTMADGDRGRRGFGGAESDGSGNRGHPQFRENLAGQYLLGMAKVKGKVKILLDIDKVMTTQDLKSFDALLH